METQILHNLRLDKRKEYLHKVAEEVHESGPAVTKGGDKKPRKDQAGELQELGNTNFSHPLYTLGQKYHGSQAQYIQSHADHPDKKKNEKRSEDKNLMFKKG